jgi:RNA polymerase sigma factor (sigma-70 family)
MNSAAKSQLFVAVLERHKGILYKVAKAYCQDEEDRKDLVQEMTVQLWRSFETYNDDYKYSTWIYRIALNVAISFYRKENRRKHLSNPLTENVLEFSEVSGVSEVEENVGFLLQFIAELKEIDKALMLIYLEEKSHREMAEIIGISESNVATKIGRIKAILKQKFSTLKN